MITKVDFSKRGKDLFYMKRDLREMKSLTSEEQRIKVCIDKETEKWGYNDKPLSINKIIKLR